MEDVMKLTLQIELREVTVIYWYYIYSSSYLLHLRPKEMGTYVSKYYC